MRGHALLSRRAEGHRDLREEDVLLQNRTDPDRRRYPRRAIEVGVELDVIREPRVIVGTSENLSLGGARVRSPAGLAVGETVLLVLTLDRVFTTFADVLDSITVVDRNEAHLRLRFWEMSPRHREPLVRYLATAGAWRVAGRVAGPPDVTAGDPPGEGAAGGAGGGIVRAHSGATRGQHPDPPVRR